MKNKVLANRIKELRKSKGFSQEELAENSGLSLRTIQRIEKGENEPRGDSLVRLAQALEVSTESLFDFSVKEDKGFLLLLHLSALCFLFFLPLGFLVPLLLWFSKKDVIKHVKGVGQKIVNFQLTWLILYPLAIYFSVIIWGDDSYVSFNGGPPAGFKPKPFTGVIKTTVLFYSINILFISVNFFLNMKKDKAAFYPGIPFLRM